MLINRDRLIQTLEATDGEQFRGLISSLKSHRLKDLTLTNVLLEAQTFQILPFALKCMSAKSKALNPDMEDVMSAWVISVSDGLKDVKHDPYQTQGDNLDELFFTPVREGKPLPNVAAEVIDHLLEDVCDSKCRHARNKPDRKNVFYTFCRMLDNVMLQRQMTFNTLRHDHPIGPIAVH